MPNDMFFDTSHLSATGMTADEIRDLMEQENNYEANASKEAIAKHIATLTPDEFQTPDLSGIATIESMFKDIEAGNSKENALLNIFQETLALGSNPTPMDINLKAFDNFNNIMGGYNNPNNIIKVDLPPPSVPPEFKPTDPTLSGTKYDYLLPPDQKQISASTMSSATQQRLLEELKKDNDFMTAYELNDKDFIKSLMVSKGISETNILSNLLGLKPDKTY